MNKFYHSRLDPAAKQIYSQIFSALQARKSKASFLVNPLGRKPDIQKIVTYINHDNSGLFYVDFTGGFQFVTQSAKMTVKFNFLYNTWQIGSVEKQIEAEISNILSKHRFASMSAYDKELALHDILAREISYNCSGANSETTTLVGAFLSRSAVCEGYAKAFNLLCERVGIPSIVITGTGTPHHTGQSEQHAWNIVNIDGIYSHIDVTWNSNGSDENNMCYDYFNLTDNEISKDHIWDKSLFPPCASDKNNYHVKNCLCFNSWSDFKRYIVEKARRGEKAIAFKLNGQEKTNNQVMSVIQEALESVLNGFSMNLLFNNKLGTGMVYLD